jgi:nucleotide-binding universal stress UspA family protein
MTSQPDQHRPQRIVVGVDGSAGSRAALRWAADEAELRDAELEVVMARVPAVPMVLFGPGSLPIPASTAPFDVEERGRTGEEVLEQILREALGTHLPPKLTWYVMDGHPVGVLVGRTTEADLLVVGARGEGGFTGLLTGSVSEHVVRHAACSVVVVRSRA